MAKQQNNNLEKEFDGKVIRTDLVANSILKREKGDELVRSLVRHDSEKISKELYKVFRKGWRFPLHYFLSFYR